MISRSNFIKKVIQVGLFALLALVVLALKNRIVGGVCSSCPEYGSCPGKKECSKF
jgi:hypothetical protein